MFVVLMGVWEGEGRDGNLRKREKGQGGLSKRWLGGVLEGKLKEIYRGRSAFELGDSHVEVRYCVVAMITLYDRSRLHERMGYYIQHFKSAWNAPAITASTTYLSNGLAIRAELRSTRWHTRRCPDTLLHDQLR